jgi:hypothetical protein
MVFLFSSFGEPSGTSTKLGCLMACFVAVVDTDSFSFLAIQPFPFWMKASLSHFYSVMLIPECFYHFVLRYYRFFLQ